MLGILPGPGTVGQVHLVTYSGEKAVEVEERRELRKAPATVEKVRGRLRIKCVCPLLACSPQMQACRLTAPRDQVDQRLQPRFGTSLLRSQFLRTRPTLASDGCCPAWL